MSTNALFNVPTPRNEQVLTYAPGSSEKAELQKELDYLEGEETSIPLIINGEERSSRAWTDVFCPHDKKKRIARCQVATPEDIQDAIHASVKAQKEWAELSWEDRSAVFLKAAELLAGPYRAKMNAATMLGQSKTCHQAEIDAACELIDFFRFNAYFAQEIYAQQPLYSARGEWNRSVPRGLEGFVFAVTPFNFTSIAVNLAASPAMMGCSVLWKPAPTSVLSSYVGMQLMQEAGLPAGVVNFVPGDAEQIGSAVLASEHLAGIHFTGSTKTFEHLWSKVGANISHYRSYPRVVGETGGKDFVFAHPSADVSRLIPALVRGAFEYQGQKCSAASRAYIPESLWGEVKEKLLESVKEIKVGNPKDFRNFMGAVIDERSYTKIQDYVEHARAAKDAELLCGGLSDDDSGYFVQPTVIHTSNHQYRSMVEEIFGPVLTIYTYPDAALEETLSVCDQTSNYGLTGAIFAKGRDVIAHLSSRLAYSAGNFYINDKPTGAVVGQQPFGGGRKSGTNDKAGSMQNLLRWASFRTIKENFDGPKSFDYPFMQEK